jgi:hypothetical protein
MHAYRNTMTWETNDEDLFVDRASVEADAKMQDDEDLAPAAIHCKNPSPFQAFHYGVHKAMKMLQPGRWPKNLHQTQFHWANVQETRNHFIESGDRRVGFAVLGAEFGLREDIEPKHISYSNPYLRDCFEQFVELETEELQTEIDRLAPFSLLPNRLRRRALIYRDRVKHMLSGTAGAQE